MAMNFQAMQELNGRMTEHWSIKITSANLPANSGSWWFDPELRVVVREELPGGEVRRLEKIVVGAIEETAFQVPIGWQQKQPTTPTAPTLQAPQPAPGN